MANKNRQKAQKMASKGASVQEIKAKTGLSGSAAKKVSSNHGGSTPQSSTSSDGGKTTGFRAAMADGKIGRKEIQAHMDAKGIKGKQQGNAQMRIADRWLSKGGALGQGVLKDYMSNYEDKNYYSAMGIKHGINPYGVFDADTKGKSKNDLYKAANSMFADKGYAKGDVFSRLKNGDLRALPPMPTGYVPPVSNPVTTQDPVTTAPGGGGGGGEMLPPPTTPVDTTPGFGIGGIGDGGEKNALTFRQNKSRWKNTGRSTKGTKNLRFNRTSGFGGFSAAAY